MKKSNRQVFFLFTGSLSLSFLSLFSLSFLSFTIHSSLSRVQVVGRLEQLEGELRRELKVRDGLGAPVLKCFFFFFVGRKRG